MNLGTLANYAQVVSVVPLFGGVAMLYFHHKCHHCKRVARFKVGDHQVPVCHRHRETQASALNRRR